ncbi:hypothetical protein [Variovorax sp. ZT4R33]|uniref:hypothetical protein n=1 Tax=Variovorax sp. ZT4R33 TaxID=3443743 RepID=UPI003F48861D
MTKNLFPLAARTALLTLLAAGTVFAQAPPASKLGGQPATSPAQLDRAAPTDPALPGDVLLNGIVDAAKYRATAAAMGTDAGIAYRYGPSAAQSGYPAATVTYAKRPDKSYDPISSRLGWSNRSCVASGGWCGTWQIGNAPSKDPGDYSSSIVNVAYVPDAVPAASFFPKKYFGVASLQQFAIAHDVVAVKPEHSWTTYDGPTKDGGANDANIELAAQTVPMDQKPVAVGKCHGRGGWCTNSIAVFANGWLMGVGSNTAHNRMMVKLADGKVPTAIAVTNSGEFALVTVWDTAAVRGQVAVVALADGCQWCDPAKESAWERNWGSARRVYHGFPGLGNYIAAKVIGYVDLPDTLKTPTEISASTGKSLWDYEIVRDFWAHDIDTADSRAKWFDGDPRSKAIARTGIAVVISKNEKRAAFIDLRPLFQYYRAQYLGKDQAGWQTLIASRGDAPNQWPLAFSVAPAQRPTLIKTVDLPARPTAVKLGLTAPYRAFIATQEGKLRVFDLGTGYLDQAAKATGKPADIVEKFAVEVGKNPTDITYVKERGWNDTTALFGPLGLKHDRSYWVTSRGERKVTLLSFDAAYASAKTVKTLTDSRIVDPIAADDGATHGTESYVLTLADYGGKAVRSYLYGPIIAWTYPAKDGWTICPAPRGCKLLNDQPFEYGGGYELPGKPFHAAGANIN